MIALNVNGKPHDLDIPDDMPRLWAHKSFRRESFASDEAAYAAIREYALGKWSSRR